MSFLDVGQGDAALIRVPGSVTVLIDGGPSEAGDKVVQALRDAGVQQVDWLIASHPHEDHIGGLPDVLRAVPVRKALDPGYNNGTSIQRTYLKLLKEKGVDTKLARSGNQYDLGSGARLEILAPEEPLLKGTESDANNNSVVARLSFGSTAFLFTGDVEEDGRARIMRSHSAADLRADVLKVAHHGSHNGTDPEFLRAVQPKFAVISCARKNDYGHPHAAALAALRDAGCQILRTDQSGTITFTSDGRSIRLASQPAPAPASAPAAAQPAPAAGSASPSLREGRVIGNRSTHVFHRTDCQALPASSRRVDFESAEAAEKAGYRPHRACMER